MKLNEKQLRNVVYSIIKESLGDLNMDMAYTRNGNGNTFDDNGRAAMAAMGEYGDEMQDVAMSDNGEGYYSPYDEDGEYYEQKPADWGDMGFRNVMEEDENNPLGINFEDDENTILEAVKNLCEDGIQYFYTILSTIEENSYAKSNPEKFKDLLEKVNGLCKSIEEILYYEFN